MSLQESNISIPVKAYRAIKVWFMDPGTETCPKCKEESYKPAGYSRLGICENCDFTEEITELLQREKNKTEQSS